MKAIYASQLYRASSHKAAINAALEDPANTELVTQLESYLSKETLRELKKGEPKEVIKIEPDSKSDEGNDNVAPSRPSGRGSAIPSGGTHMTDEIVDDFSEGEPTQLDEEFEEGIVEETPEEEVESATDIDVEEPESSIADLVTERLNVAVPEISNNISRIANKHDNELWIYFNDDTNLNNVMTPVIDELDALVQFNRLARSNNAIVFETLYEVSPIKTVDEGDIDDNPIGEIQ